MNDQYVRNVIEAALLAAGRPLASDELVTLFDERDGSNAEEVMAAIAALRSEYETRGLELVEVASGYRIQIRHAVAQPVSRLWQERPTKYSRALLETLALVAYRQPITRGEIEQIRGVAVNPNIIKTLLERSWIRVIGHRDVPGKPELLGTTRDFLDYFSLQKLDDLPTLAELKELEELRVQLSLPGAERAVISPDIESASGAEAAVHAGAPEGSATGAGATESGAAEAGAANSRATELRAHEPAAAVAVPTALDGSELAEMTDDESAADESGVPGEDARYEGESAAARDAEADAPEDDEDMDAGDSAPHRPHGLVARGGADDELG